MATWQANSPHASKLARCLSAIAAASWRGLCETPFKKVPLKVNLSVHGPFRALIQMAKGFKDPTSVIQPVLPFPLDTPGLATETRVLKKEEEQQSNVPPIQEQVDVSTKPQPSE